MTEKIVITGMGVISAAGVGVHALFDATLTGRSGINRWPDSNHPWVAGFIPEHGIDAKGSMQLPANLDRHVALATHAVAEAMAAAGLSKLGGTEAEKTGIFWGTGAGSANTVEESYQAMHQGRRARPLTILLAMQNAAVAQLALEYGLRGPQLSISQACASAAAAIGEGLLALRHGRAERMIVGGSEAPLTTGQMLSWEALRVLAKLDPEAAERSCRPFDRRRSGLVLAEGAGALVLETESAAKARGATILCELCGYGNAGDASHYARPDPDGQIRAMRQALADARLDTSQIGYINAHATATTVGDIVEASAIRSHFGSTNNPAISSTKAIHGHTLGAAGAIELIITACALQAGQLPPTAFLEDPETDEVDLILGEARAQHIEAALSNTFAFGGSNISLAIRRYGD